MKNDIQFSMDQLTAISHFDTPVLISGGAGTGKTTTLAYKIIEMISKNHYSANQILVLTANQKGTQNIHSIIHNQCPDLINQLNIFSFDQFFMSLLRAHHKETQGYTLLKNSNRRAIIYAILSKLKLNQQSIEPSTVISIIKRLKQQGVEVATFKNQQSTPFESDIYQIYNQYQKALKRNHLFDKEDLLILFNQLICKTPALLKQLQAQYHAIYIDHMEMITPLQLKVIQKLQHNSHFYAAYDIDQMIEGHPTLTLSELEKIQKSNETYLKIMLTENYSSTSHIISLAKQITDNRHIKKNIKLSSNNQLGESAKYYIAANENDEMQFIIEEIQALISTVKLNNIGILYRSKNHAAQIQNALSKAKIPTHFESQSSNFSKTGVKLFCHILRATINHFDTYTIDAIQDQSLWDIPKKERSKLLKTLSKNISNMSLQDRLNTIFEASGYRSHLEGLNSLDAYEKLENVSAAITYFYTHFSSLEEIVDAESLKQYKNNNDIDAVRLIAINKTKEYQYQAIFIPGIEEGLLPHYHSQFDYDSLEEERNLLYLGITRASRYLYLSSASHRQLYKKTWHNDPSRFILDAPKLPIALFISNELEPLEENTVAKKLEEKGYHYDIRKANINVNKSNLTPSTFQTGDFVSHSKWGNGLITEIEGDSDDAIFSVAFQDNMRKIMVKYANLKKVK